MRMTSTIAAVLIVTAGLGQYERTIAACVADYAVQGGSTRYLVADHLAEEQLPDAELAARFWLPHLSRELALGHQTPAKLPGVAAWRIQLEGLGWSIESWRKVAARYPYTAGQKIADPLMLRLDWLLRQTADATESTAYYDLLLGGPPADRTAWLKALAIGDAQERLVQAQVLDRGKSGVARNTRLIAWHNVSSGYLAETADSKRGSGKQDPFERQDFKADAAELIASLPKVLSDGSQARVLTQAYLLTDGQGKRVDVADTAIVNDHNRFLGNGAIRTPGSCVGCHAALNGSRSNLFAEYLRLPGEPKLYVEGIKNQVRFDAKYLGSLAKQIRRGNEDFAEFCLDHLNEDPKTAARTWTEFMSWYDSDLDLNQAAREVGAKSHDELRLAIGHYSSTLGPAQFAGRLTLLAEGERVTRHAWEDATHYQATLAIRAWRHRQ